MSAEGPIPINPGTCGESSSNFPSHSSLIHSFKKNLLRRRLWLIRIEARSSQANRSRRRRHDPNRGQLKGKHAKGSRPQKHGHKTNRLNKNKREPKGPNGQLEAVRDVRLDAASDNLGDTFRSGGGATTTSCSKFRMHRDQKRRSCPGELVVK